MSSAGLPVGVEDWEQPPRWNTELWTCCTAARSLQILTSLGATAKQLTSANILFWLSDERLPTTASQTNAPSSGKKTLWRTKKPKWTTEGSLLLLSVQLIANRNLLKTKSWDQVVFGSVCFYDIVISFFYFTTVFAHYSLRKRFLCQHALQTVID